LWSLMIRDLHPIVAQAAEPGFLDGHYSAAAMQTYVALEESIRQVAGHAGSGNRKFVPIGALLNEWLNSRNGDPQKPDKVSDSGNWSQFARSCFALVRNPLAHNSTEMTAKDAFVVLCLADFIARGILS